jgi:hypothetical protein
MAAGVFPRVREWLRSDGGPALFALILCWGGGLVFLALLVWLIESPLRPWWATCLGLAILVSLGHRAWLAVHYRRWNDRAVAAHQAGVLDTTPPPRLSEVSVAVLCVQLGLALGGLVLIVLDLLRFFALLG